MGHVEAPVLFLLKHPCFFFVDGRLHAEHCSEVCLGLGTAMSTATTVQVIAVTRGRARTRKLVRFGMLACLEIVQLLAKLIQHVSCCFRNSCFFEGFVSSIFFRQVLPQAASYL